MDEIRYDVARILQDLGIKYKNLSQKSWAITCLNPDHAERKPSMGIHKKLGIFHCFGCGYKGNIYKLLHHFGIENIDAYIFLRKYIVGYEIKNSIYDNIFFDYKKENVQNDFKLPSHRKLYEHPYLTKRGVTRDDIEEWSISVVTGNTYTGWILFPLYQDKKLCNYFLRSPYGNGKITAKKPKGGLFAGIDFVKNYDTVCIVEGIFDCISVKHTGRQAIACMTNSVTKDQLNLLKKFKRLIIIPDNDPGGIRLVERISPLIHTLDIKVGVLPPYRKDAGESTKEEIEASLQALYSWEEYLILKKHNLKDFDYRENKN